MPRLSTDRPMGITASAVTAGSKSVGAPGSARRPPPFRPTFSVDGLWHNLSVRALVYQALVIIAVVALVAYLASNAQSAMARRGIATGFGFLFSEAGFPIGEGLVPFLPTDTFLKAFAAALVNTLSVSVVSVVGATLLGLIVGLARLSPNWLVAKLATLYVEVFRNTPQLVQISFWYLLVTRLPQPRQAWDIAGFGFLSNRGLTVATPAANASHVLMAIALLAGCVGAVLLSRRAEQQLKATGRRPVTWPWITLLILGLPLAVWTFSGAPTQVSVPQLRGFNFVGGATLSPEFIALFLGLSLYIAAFIAEIVRAGIQSVGRGQIEAARSIGLSNIDVQRRIVLPQAMRVMVPPATSQYVSLMKNSSLGTAIGYPEVFNITNTAITLSGHTIECMLIMASSYLLISFSIAALMNAYNRLVQINER